jgi:hypothetical protein
MLNNVKAEQTELRIMEEKEMSSKRTIFQVNGKPFIAIAGEARNSSASNAQYMLKVWERAKELGLNTVFLPVSWELIEPVEGQFEFQLIDDIINQARGNEMHIIFLWFGSWKNASCMYAPEWVKKDLVRFPRAQVEKGKNKIRLVNFYGMEYTTLSYLGKETNQADAKAFTEFMKYLKNVDEKQRTVIAVQVENEVGIMGSAREHSDYADRLFAEAVPEEFLSYMKYHTAEMEHGIKEVVENCAERGSWEEVFGAYAEEVFSAYYIASYVEKVASAGKRVYPLPMTVNCWLDKGEEAGMYPSGGPVAKVIEVWKYAAPSIDVFTPDIYVPNFCEVCNTFTKLDNPLFIPETATHSHAAPRQVYAVGHYHATCYAPFGFEDMGHPFEDSNGVLFGMDTSDPLLQTPQNVDEYKWCSNTLNSMMDLITSKYGTSDLQAVISERIDHDEESSIMIFGEFGFKVIMNLPIVTRTDGVCMIVKESEDTFYILANGCLIAPFSVNPGKSNCDIISIEEGKFADGKWESGRRLNGDEVILCFNTYTLIKLKVFTYN